MLTSILIAFILLNITNSAHSYRAWAQNRIMLSGSKLLSNAYHRPVRESLTTNKRGIDNEEYSATKFLFCEQCKAAYVFDPTKFKSIRRFKCSVCSYEWKNSADTKLYTLGPLSKLVDIPHEMLSERSGNATKLTTKTISPGIFIKNIPLTYLDYDVLQLFAEYGVVNLHIARDRDGKSKGFAFMDLETMDDANRALNEMNGFYIDYSNKLFVEMRFAFDSKEP